MGPVDATPESVLEFWFGNALESPESTAARRTDWFGKDPAFDEHIRERFGELPSRAMLGELDTWRKEARPSLALVLILDQFPRNLYRGSPQAFACDALAREIAGTAIESQFDSVLAPLEAVFLYLPLEHAEDMAAQDCSVARFEALLKRAPASQRQQFESFLSYAIRHREVIGRFGRFPHRNAILGRHSTGEELSYLDSGGESF